MLYQRPCDTLPSTAQMTEVRIAHRGEDLCDPLIYTPPSSTRRVTHSSRIYISKNHIPICRSLLQIDDYTAFLFPIDRLRKNTTLKMTLPDPIRHNVNFITGNAHKLREVKAILEPAIQVDSQTLDLIEIQGTIEEVTLDKCRRAADLVCSPTITRFLPKSFESDRLAMGNLDRGPSLGRRYMPGFQRTERLTWPLHVCFPVASLPLLMLVNLHYRCSSKWFMASLGHQGLNNLLAAYEDKSAQAICTFAYSPGPGHEPILFQGITDGKIVPPRGPPDFGWDAIFEYQGET